MPRGTPAARSRSVATEGRRGLCGRTALLRREACLEALDGEGEQVGEALRRGRELGVRELLHLADAVACGVAVRVGARGGLGEAAAREELVAERLGEARMVRGVVAVQRAEVLLGVGAQQRAVGMREEQAVDAERAEGQ